MKLSQQLKKFTGLHTVSYSAQFLPNLPDHGFLNSGFQMKICVAAFIFRFDSPFYTLTISTFPYYSLKCLQTRGAMLTVLPVFPNSTSASCIANCPNKHTLKCSLVELSASSIELHVAYLSFPHAGGDRGKVTCTMLT